MGRLKVSNPIVQTIFFKASPHEIFEALMDSAQHTAFSGAAAQISREVGGEFSAYDGYITGKNLELVPDRKIVQLWRAVDWPAGHFSTVSFILAPEPEGTRLEFLQVDLPAGTEAEFAQGWIDNYWEPLKAWLEK
jgi:activator of HSP90 ATPase